MTAPPMMAGPTDRTFGSRPGLQKYVIICPLPPEARSPTIPREAEFIVAEVAEDVEAAREMAIGSRLTARAACRCGVRFWKTRTQSLLRAWRMSSRWWRRARTAGANWEKSVPVFRGGYALNPLVPVPVYGRADMSCHYAPVATCSPAPSATFRSCSRHASSTARTNSIRCA